MTSYHRECVVVVASVSVPAFGFCDAIIVLRWQPAGEGRVGGSHTRILPVSSTMKHFYFETSHPKEVCTFHVWSVMC